MTRMDGAPLVSVQTGISKAYAAAAIGMPPDDFYSAIQADGAAVASFATRPGLALVAGGLPVLVDGQIAGGVGVAGAMTGAEDRSIAEAAVRGGHRVGSLGRGHRSSGWRGMISMLIRPACPKGEAGREPRGLGFVRGIQHEHGAWAPGAPRAGQYAAALQVAQCGRPRPEPGAGTPLDPRPRPDGRSPESACCPISLGLEAGSGPALEHVRLLPRPGAIAGHRTVMEPVQDVCGVCLDVGR